MKKDKDPKTSHDFSLIRLNSDSSKCLWQTDPKQMYNILVQKKAVKTEQVIYFWRFMLRHLKIFEGKVNLTKHFFLVFFALFFKTFTFTKSVYKNVSVYKYV